jgi:hypothetical protein
MTMLALVSAYAASVNLPRAYSMRRRKVVLEIRS